jgi:succinate-semialdehyde dehydrogenase/glutarate-semialdehyde dehydrogenase
MRAQNYVRGEWVASQDGASRTVTNPADDSILAQVPYGGADDARIAVDAASEALPEWRAKTAQERGMLLRRLAELMLRDQQALADLLSREQGKPVAEAAGEIAYAASFIDWAAEEGKRLYGDLIPGQSADRRILVLRQSVGVCGIITPWNFPAAMITRKLGPALASGCTVVVKPATQTPLSAFALAECCHAAGIPPGVVNVITGSAQAIAGAWLDDARVRKLSFTGSTEVGRVLMARAATHLTRLSLELGGHAPLLVFDDADVERAVEGAMASKFRNMGQTCICTNRFLVQEGIYARFVAALVARTRSLRVGPGGEIGPLIDDAAVAKVEAHVADAVAKGARVTTGGKLAAPAPGLCNRYFQPTVVEHVRPDMRIYREETFGPVAPILSFCTEDEGVALANDCEYGLAAYLFTQDAARLMRVAERLEYGIVGANDGAVSTAQAPFGGVKHSGFGREGGRYVMDEYTERKYVCWRL